MWLRLYQVETDGLLACASGNLCYQIEHHLFPDLPSNRYAEIATRVRALCDKFDLPYTTGSLLGQYLQTVRTIHKLALPDRFLAATGDDARHGVRTTFRTDTAATRVQMVPHQGGEQGCAPRYARVHIRPTPHAQTRFTRLAAGASGRVTGAGWVVEFDEGARDFGYSCVRVLGQFDQ